MDYSDCDRGGNDVIGDFRNAGSLSVQSDQNYSNGFWNRYYLAVTKNFHFEGLGAMGAHISWIYSKRFDNKLNDPVIGVNFRFKLKESGSLVNKMINDIALMTEIVPSHTNVKGVISIWLEN